MIPKAIREQIGIEPGDEVEFEPAGKEVRIRRLADSPERRRERIDALAGSWGDVVGLSTKDLEAERREERRREELKAKRLLDDRP